MTPGIRELFRRLFFRGGHFVEVNKVAPVALIDLGGLPTRNSIVMRNYTSTRFQKPLQTGPQLPIERALQVNGNDVGTSQVGLQQVALNDSGLVRYSFALDASGRLLNQVG